MQRQGLLQDVGTVGAGGQALMCGEQQMVEAGALRAGGTPERGDGVQELVGQHRSRKTAVTAVAAQQLLGRGISITYRKIKNDRLAAAGWVWSFAAACNPGPARLHYQRRREHGDRHNAALRHLFNKMLGQLHHCLHTRQTFDPDKAFGHIGTSPEPMAA
ncbi:hypothetical protein [Nocardia farcinica]|uniref:hypothetical protein n=1 Tax=Nocardia farcinica TaxID=37329 RepID=UPI003CC7E6EE